MQICVNDFTLAEWPGEGFASTAGLSIGEEQSDKFALALEWSPPGLAKHQRCALAVLTSNLLLCLWATPSDSVDTQSWRRVAIINDTLKAWLEDPESGVEDDVPLRRRKRVRAAVWAPPLPGEADTGSSGGHSALLSVLNDASEVVLLRIEYDRIGTQETTASVIAFCKVSQTPTQDSNGELEHLEWSQWALITRGYCARLRCTEMGSTASIQVTIQSSGCVEMVLRNWKADVDCATLRGLPGFIQGISPGAGDSLERAVTRVSRRFANHYGLEGRVNTRPYGWSASGELVALSFSVHPNEQIEYRTPAKELSYVVFAGNASNPLESFPWETDSPPRNPIGAHVALWKILCKEIPQMVAETNGQRSNPPQDEPADAVPTAINTIDTLVGLSIARTTIDRSIDFVSELQRDQEYYFTGFCAHILINRDPCWLSGHKDFYVSPPTPMGRAIIEARELAERLEGEKSEATVIESLNQLIEKLSHPLVKAPITRCQICRDPLLWGSLYSAQCKRGHRFGQYSFCYYLENAADKG